MKRPIIKSCPWQGCGEETTVFVPGDGYKAWQAGELIQVALPNLTVEERETLMTGYCKTHQELMFTYVPDEDEDDEDFYYEDVDGDMTDHEIEHQLERRHPDDEAFRVDRRVCQGIGCVYGNAPGMQDQR